jgi:hypothetical protein
MTQRRKRSAPASKREHVGADVLTYPGERAAKAPESAASEAADETTATQQRPCWSAADILTIARSLRVR